jgi:hypothetical protein
MKQTVLYAKLSCLPNKNSYELEAHLNTSKHKKQIQSCQNTPKVSEIFLKFQTQKKGLLVTEGALSFHAINHHLSCRSMGRISKLNQVIYSNSEIKKK